MLSQKEILSTIEMIDQQHLDIRTITMCAGAILNARIPRVFYGARDEAMGACGGVTNLFMESFPNRPALVGGILGNECREVLTAFFEGLRRRESGGQQKKTPPEKI